MTEYIRARKAARKEGISITYAAIELVTTG